MTGTVAASVGMVPEGLVVPTSMAFGVAAVGLARRSTLMQELPAIEVLARADVVCLDKTANLTYGDILPKVAGCRLLIRVRADPSPGWLRRFLPLSAPVHLTMEQKIPRTIKQRTEPTEPRGLLRQRRGRQSSATC